MKLTKVLLRWYKSFNINYSGYDDRRSGVVHRPWNSLNPNGNSALAFEFIEIDIEPDITTIIGANESGKSHLLSAVSKVITGLEESTRNAYKISDLCYYASVKNINTNIWPNIGIEVLLESENEVIQLVQAAGPNEISGVKHDGNDRAVIILHGEQGTLYINGQSEGIPLDGGRLAKVRHILPKVEFIDSKLAISDEISLAQLIANYDDGAEELSESFADDAAQEAARFIMSAKLNDESKQAVLTTDFELIKQLRGRLRGGRVSAAAHGSLEALLFKDILKIDVGTLKTLYRLSRSDRSYAEGIVSEWNRALEETLNLSKSWSQDELFRLELNLKNNVIYFQISDKTNSTYTFKDRSSGLRYFLSYYIQAKALELSNRNQGCIILMDEPDSFLSSVGQKNLLQVFESLVRPESSHEKCQLIYSTHSPFLINKNFPRRIRLLKKGDAEEGSQHIHYAMLRRYEPIRTALGIDCAQTLFLGSTNVIVEGPTDQFILSELIRYFTTPETFTSYLDLNSITIVSSENPTRIDQLLQASMWEDEPIQSTIVLLDDDECGNTIRDSITGKSRGKKQLIAEKYVVQYGEIFPEVSGRRTITTLEDVLPPNLYLAALDRYLEKWEQLNKKQRDGIITKIASEISSDPKIPIVEVVRKHFEANFRLDKLGICKEIILLLNDRNYISANQTEINELSIRLEVICSHIKERIQESLLDLHHKSFKDNIQRVISDFLKLHQFSSSVADMSQLVSRLTKEGEATTATVDVFIDAIGELAKAVTLLRAGGVNIISNDIWPKWFEILTRIKRNPVKPEKPDIKSLIGTSDSGSNAEKSSENTKIQTTKHTAQKD